MDTPELSKAKAEVAAAVAKVDNYEVDVISFVSAHKLLAVQFAVIVCSPIGFIAYELGKHYR